MDLEGKIARQTFFRVKDRDGPLVLRASRSRGGDAREAGAVHSTRVLATVRREAKPVIVSTTEEGQELGSESILTHDLRRRSSSRKTSSASSISTTIWPAASSRPRTWRSSRPSAVTLP